MPIWYQGYFRVPLSSWDWYPSCKPLISFQDHLSTNPICFAGCGCEFRAEISGTGIPLVRNTAIYDGLFVRPSCVLKYMGAGENDWTPKMDVV